MMLLLVVALPILWLAVSTRPPNPRVGFYQWVGFSSRAPNGDLLTAARQRVEASGAGLFRFYLGPNYDYEHPPMSPQRFPTLHPATADAIVGLPIFRAALDDTALPVEVLTVDLGSQPCPLIRWNAAREDEDAAQMARLVNRLYQDFGGLRKTIILCNWEADNELINNMNAGGDPATMESRMIARQNRRYDALQAVRHSKGPLRILMGFEMNLVNLKIRREGGEYIKHPNGTWNALNDVVPHLRFDVLSYSAYESVDSPYGTGQRDTPPSGVGDRLRRDVGMIRRVCHKPLMLGEIGLAWDRYDGLSSGGVVPRLSAALSAINDLRPEYVVFWQVFDCPPHHEKHFDDPSGWGWLDPSRSCPTILRDFIAYY